ncbi:hypothetical protein OPIT5_09525 [Opitutaceae bacterium TAV5]|nr:hypothetical protein OPIT5_09525 [Opitutaceae bacterium TAV5]
MFSSVNLFFRTFRIFFEERFFKNLQRTPFVFVATVAP